MAEDTFLKCQREYFAQTQQAVLDVPEKKLNKILEAYNKYMQKQLIGESPIVAQDLKLTILKSRETDAAVKESGKPRVADSKA